MDVVILAAGRGNRFFANSSKVNMNFWGISVVKMLCLNAQKISQNVYVVVKEGNTFDLPKETITVYQNAEYGTGAAAQSYLQHVKEERDTLFIPGDAPLVDYEVINKFRQRESDADILLGIMKMPKGQEFYGRIFIENGIVTKIVEYKHFQEKTQYANTGIILISKKAVHLLKELQVGESGEIYLTGIIELANKKGYKVKSVILSHEEALGFNTISEFHKLLEIAQKKWRKKALLSSAIFFDINKVYLSYDTEFELGAVIEPYVRFLPGVKIGSQGTIKAFSSLENCYINGKVGPFAHIRSGELQVNSEIGAFVEINRAIIGESSKAKHLTYLGDVELKKEVNVGAGCVVCNYDGKNKHKTVINEKAFIGANTTLISPLIIGKGAFLAAGSTFNQNVEDGKLAIARAYQVNKEKKD